MHAQKSRIMAPRRKFMFDAALAGGTALLGTAAMATPSNARRYASTLKFSAVGQVENGLADVLTNVVLAIPPLPPTAEFWIDMEFGSGGRDVLHIEVYVLIPQPALDPVEIPISRFDIGIEDVKLSETSVGWTNFGLFGVVTQVDFSPFPDLLGHPAAVGGRYHAGTFDLLAGNVFGSHVTVVRTGSGVLQARLPYNAY